MAEELRFKSPIGQPELPDREEGDNMNTLDNPTPEQLAYRQEYDRLDAMGMYTPTQIEAQLAKKGLHPNPPTAEEIEEAEVREITERHRQAPAKQAKPKRKPPTRYVSPRDAGPPEHIARQMRDE